MIEIHLPFDVYSTDYWICSTSCSRPLIWFSYCWIYIFDCSFSLYSWSIVSRALTSSRLDWSSAPWSWSTGAEFAPVIPCFYRVSIWFYKLVTLSLCLSSSWVNSLFCRNRSLLASCESCTALRSFKITSSKSLNCCFSNSTCCLRALDSIYKSLIY